MQPAADRLLLNQSSSFRMRVVNHNWSATKQRLHPQSVAEISHHSVLSSSGSRHKDTYRSVSPFPSAGTAVSLFRAKTVKQVAEGGQNLVAGLWGHTLGEN